MADEKQIVIDIRSSQPSPTGQSISQDEGSSSFSKDLSKLLHPIRTLETETVGKNIILNQAYQNAKQNVRQMIDFSMNRYFNMKEDYISQNALHYVTSDIKQIGSVLGAAGSGALLGASVGGPIAPVTAAIGAVVSAGAKVVSDVINYNQKLSGYYSALNATNFQTSFQASKMNLIDDNRNTLN